MSEETKRRSPMTPRTIIKAGDWLEQNKDALSGTSRADRVAKLREATGLDLTERQLQGLENDLGYAFKEPRQREAARADSEEIASLLEYARESSAAMEAFTAGIEKMHEQHVAMNAAMASMRDRMECLLGEISSSIGGALQVLESSLSRRILESRDCVGQATEGTPALVLPIDSTKAPAPKTAAAPARVVLVGLTDSQASMIRQEFSSCFDLRTFTADEAKRPSCKESVARADALVVMTAFIDHGIERIAREAGTKLVRVRGGMSSLRDALTDLYVQLSEKAPKAA